MNAATVPSPSAAAGQRPFGSPPPMGGGRTGHWLMVPAIRSPVLLAGTASLLLNLAMLVPSLYTLQVFDRVFSSRSLETLAMLTLLSLASLAFAYGMDVARARALAGAGRTLHSLLSPPALQQALRRSASGMKRPASDRLRDIAQLRHALSSAGVRAVFDAPWLPVYLLVIGLMHPLLSLASAIGAALMGVLAWVTDAATRGLAEDTARQTVQAGRHTEALVRHAEMVVGMGMEQSVVDHWSDSHEQLLHTQARLAARGARLAAVARVLRQCVQLAVLAVGAWLVVDSGASAGIMIAATLLLGRALQPVEQLIAGWKQLVDARSAWQRLCEPDAMTVPAPRPCLPPPSGRLELDRVLHVAGVSRMPLIKGISMTLNAGESLGIVGASGSGKTTLALLMLGLRRPQGGSVRMDGVDISRWDRNDLGPHLGYMPQEASLLSASVAQNIARLGVVDAQRVVAAAREAGAHELILRLPDGYETLIGEDGLALSGGQRQRISLARALYGQPRLLVLDEPDLNLDGEGLDALHAALGALKQRGASAVVVGHRTSLMARLDKVAVLKDGSLHDFGPAAAVLARVHESPPRAASAPVLTIAGGARR